MHRLIPHVDARLRAALEAGPARVTIFCEADGTIIWISESVRRLLGRDPDDLVGRPVFDCYEPTDGAYSRMAFATAAADPARTVDQVGAVARTARVYHADGSLVLIESFPIVMLNDPAINGVMLEWTPARDRTALKDAIDAVAGRRPPAESISRIVAFADDQLGGTDVGMAALLDGRWRTIVSPGDRDPDRFAELLPGPVDPSWDEPFVLDVDDELGRWAGPGLDAGLRPVRGVDGELLATFVFVRAGMQRLRGVVTSAENLLDIAFRLSALTLANARHRAELREAAEQDPLTGLANRAGLARWIDRQSADHSRVAVLYVDIDDFKPINDRHGHAVGDRVLTEIGRRLSASLRDVDVAARLGGDEFVVASFAPWTEAGAERLRTRLVATLEEPVVVTDDDGRVRCLDVGVSVGSAIGETAGIEAVMAEADEALYAVKRARKSRLGLGARH